MLTSGRDHQMAKGMLTSGRDHQSRCQLPGTAYSNSLHE